MTYNVVIKHFYLLINAYEFTYKLSLFGMLVMIFNLIITSNLIILIGFGILTVFFLIFYILYRNETKRLLKFVKWVNELYLV